MNKNIKPTTYLFTVLGSFCLSTSYLIVSVAYWSNLYGISVLHLNHVQGILTLAFNPTPTPPLTFL